LLSKLDKEINLKELKYSKEEIKLINILIKNTNLDFNDDYKFNKALSNNYYQDILRYLNELYNIELDNKYTNNKDYIANIKTLKINGNDLIKLGYKKKKIKEIQNELLENIYQEKLNNNYDDLINYIQTKK